MRVALVAGESSGDLLGAGLIRAIRARNADAVFEGVAGPAMAAAGCEVIENAEALAVMGLIEPLREIPRLFRLRRSLVERWTTAPPDVFVGIDAPDFNLGLELRLRRNGVPTVHYVSPSVWAWRQGRIRTIAKAVDKVLCLLPFEKSFYDDNGVDADFVGHPMADRLSPDVDSVAARNAAGASGAPVVAVLPGSRKSEVSKLGPVFAEAAQLLEVRYPEIDIIAPMATPAIRELFGRQLKAAGATKVILLNGEAETAISAADVVLLASGTATLQTALLGKPMVAAYRLAPLTYALAKGLGLVKVPYISLPNLLTDEPQVPEFIQGAATPGALADAVAGLLDDADRRRSVATAFRSLQSTLARDADQRAADATLEVAAR
jgi:lipid-A-disaccharide synthase